MVKGAMSPAEESLFEGSRNTAETPPSFQDVIL
jgi:hypothetical protein